MKNREEERDEEPRAAGFQPAPHRADKTVRMSIAIGRREGIRPADIVGSIANEADVPGREIGPIEIQDEVTYVGIPERYVEAVIEKVGRKRFRGKALNIKVAPVRDEAPRRRPAPPRMEDRRSRTDDRPRPRTPQKPFDRFAKKKPRR